MPSTGNSAAKEDTETITPAGHVELWYYVTMAGFLALGGAYFYFSARKNK